VADTVWLITTGEYSDYAVLCAFTTRDLAEQYVAAVAAQREGATYIYSSDVPVIEEFPLFSEPKPLDQIYWRAEIGFKDGVAERESLMPKELPVWKPMPNYELLVQTEGKWASIEGPDRDEARRRIREYAATRLLVPASSSVASGDHDPDGGPPSR